MAIQRRVLLFLALAVVAVHLPGAAATGVCTNGATCAVPLPGIVSQGRVFQCSAGCSGAAPALTDGNTSTTWTSPINVQRISLNLPLETYMTIYSVNILFAASSGPPQAFTLSFRNALNQSKIVVHQFAANCSYFGKQSQNEATESDVETYCTQTGGRLAQSADLTLGRSLIDSLTPQFITTSLVELELLALPAGKTRYVIESIVVSGTCFCNGRATACAPIAYQGAPSCSQNSDCPSNICAGGACALAAAVPAGCACEDHSAGANCESCAPLFNAVPWTPGSQPSSVACEECTCNGHATACHLDVGRYNDIGDGGVCNCTDNTVGADCSACANGFHFDPAGPTPFSSPSACQACACNTAGSVGIGCSDEGKCTCKANVIDDDKCSGCQPHFWGLNAANPYGCSACACDSPGAFGNLACNVTTGACVCKPNVIGAACDTCAPRSYHGPFSVGMTGCTDCACDSVGALNDNCDSSSGQCACRSGVTGRACDTCATNHYGFGLSGCTNCACHPTRSVGPACNVSSGQCVCQAGSSGRDCATCDAGYYAVADGPCLSCGCSADGATSNACSNGVCTCRPGFTGDKCDQCAFASVGVYPQCTACSSCFSAWKTSLQQLIANIATAFAGAAAVTSRASGDAASQALLLQQVDVVQLRLFAVSTFVDTIDVDLMVDKVLGTGLSHAAISALILSNQQSIANLTTAMGVSFAQLLPITSALSSIADQVRLYIDGLCEPGQPSTLPALDESLQLLTTHRAAVEIETGDTSNDIRFRFRSVHGGPLVWFGESSSADHVSITVSDQGFVEVSVSIGGQTRVLSSANTNPVTSLFDGQFHSVRFVRGNNLQLFVDSVLVDSSTGSLGPLLRPTSSTVMFGSTSNAHLWTGCLDAILIDGVVVTRTSFLPTLTLMPCASRACMPANLAADTTALTQLSTLITAKLALLDALETSIATKTASVAALGPASSAAGTQVSDVLVPLMQALGSNLTAIAALVNETDEHVLTINSIIADFPSLDAAQAALASAETTLLLSRSLIGEWAARRDAWINFGVQTNRTVSHARWAIEDMLARGEAIAAQTQQARAWHDAVPAMQAQVQLALAVDGPLQTVQSDAAALAGEVLPLNGNDARAFRLDMEAADAEPLVTYDTTGEAAVALLESRLAALPLPGTPMQPRASATVAQLTALAAAEAAVLDQVDAISLGTYPAEYDSIGNGRTAAITRANTLCDTVAATTASAFATFAAVDAKNRRLSATLSSASAAQTAATSLLTQATQTATTANACSTAAAALASTSSVQALLTQLNAVYQQQVSDLAALDSDIAAAEARLTSTRNQFYSLPLCVTP